MKVRVLIVGIFIFQSLCLNASNRLDSLLSILDKTVAHREDYSEQKEELINKLKNQLNFATVDEQTFNLTGRLFHLYSNYQTDSAYSFAKLRVELAERLNNPEMIATAKMNKAEVFRTTGMYKEGLSLLDEINKNKLRDYNERYYLHLRHSLYLLLRDYSISEEDKKAYNALVFNYKDSILRVTQQEEMDFYLVGSTKNIMLGEYEKALQIIQEAYYREDKKAMTCYTLSTIYKHLGDRDKEKSYLAESAIVDLQQGVKEYISLQELAVLLFEEGDVDRAYVYMKVSMEDAIFCNARLRTLEISRMLPLINKTHNIKMEQERKRLFRLVVVTIILAIILLITLIFIYRQVKKLSSIRQYQKKMNIELQEMNSKLNYINSELMDSNLIKEEYISSLFKICSSYINKLEDFRKIVNRKIKTGQIEDLNKMTSSSSLVGDELKEFYLNFDTIFINLYPTFITDFNNLLDEDGKIEPKESDLLTPELRIYALIRLGINDSVKIADFLHYSPQTIYNYRLKIRKKLTISKRDFYDSLSKIGLRKA